LLADDDKPLQKGSIRAHDHTREVGIAAKFGGLAGIVRILSHDPLSTKALASGASGEMPTFFRELADTLGTSAVLLIDAGTKGEKGST